MDKLNINILFLTKRGYTGKDLINDLFGRLRELPLELAKRGQHVNGLCLSYNTRREGKFRDEKVIWESVNIGRLIVPGILRYIVKALKNARKSDVIVACSDSIYGILGLCIARIYHIPLIFDLYDNFESFFFARMPLLKQVYRYVIRKSDAVTCVSKPLIHRIKETYGKNERVYLLENAVRKDLFYPMDKHECRDALGLPSDARIFGTAGALNSNRGSELLFKVYFRLLKKYSNLHLVLAGPKEIEIPKHDGIHYIGNLPLEKISVILNAIDVAVICNRDNEFGRYCFPQKAREIMACDVPLIAAKVGSMEALFLDRPEWLYEWDSPDSLEFVLENRMTNKETGYPRTPEWSDMAEILENVIINVSRKHV